MMISCTKETMSTEDFLIFKSVSSIITNDSTTGKQYHTVIVPKYNSDKLKFLSISDKEGTIVIENYSIKADFIANDTLDLYYKVFTSKELVDGLFLNYTINDQYKSKAIYGPYTVFTFREL